MNKVNDKKKSHETAHMLRDYMRKEKATTKLYKDGNMTIMFKRLQR